MVCGVAVIAASVSYRHAYAVVTDYGESGATAIIPLTIDGLVHAASMVVLHSARVGVKSPPLAWIPLWLGITATLPYIGGRPSRSGHRHPCRSFR
ncbi:DUF2637 domain-containing protein [Streptomonospora alba]|uniref:DUF2637 domain-containing protein n=1 Tax=Streptomonospora alba TaxID=183763 RepID=UPI0023785874|nr:DUF2637 domain-containing protein [Streptomonospora alba]